MLNVAPTEWPAGDRDGPGDQRTTCRQRLGAGYDTDDGATAASSPAGRGRHRYLIITASRAFRGWRAGSAVRTPPARYGLVDADHLILRHGAG